jgi:hypothetical protein
VTFVSLPSKVEPQARLNSRRKPRISILSRYFGLMQERLRCQAQSNLSRSLRHVGTSVCSGLFRRRRAASTCRFGRFAPTQATQYARYFTRPTQSEPRDTGQGCDAKVTVAFQTPTSTLNEHFTLQSTLHHHCCSGWQSGELLPSERQRAKTG